MASLQIEIKDDKIYTYFDSINISGETERITIEEEVDNANIQGEGQNVTVNIKEEKSPVEIGTRSDNPSEIEVKLEQSSESDDNSDRLSVTQSRDAGKRPLPHQLPSHRVPFQGTCTGNLLQRRRWQMEDFKFEDASGVIFEGKGEMVKCGTCGERFFRIVSHLKSNSTCALKIDLEEFRKQLNRYNSRKRKRKSDDIAREKDIEAFRQELRRRKRKSDDKAREKDLAAFRQELRKRKRKSDDKARKMDLAAFREAARRRKKRSDVSLCRKDKISFIAKKQDPVSSDSDRSLE
ncbi:uncharacterized protein LOC113575187 isoform X1 [Electrophorus electricus]|uniref:uncharacterized protein LOC113575187 isoform X1 n=1 Tax=Electrophorus electricus TaxID=8005 RepID=UPI000F0A27B7|nr:uncharacterized protein LOC113575187 isoform X1 [Electrophorus electricus]